MVNPKISLTQFRRLIVYGGKKPNDELSFRNNSAGVFHMYIGSDETYGKVPPNFPSAYPMDYYIGAGSPTWSAKSGYSQYDLGVGNELNLYHQCYQTYKHTSNYTLMPKLMTGGSFSPNSQFCPPTYGQDYRYVYAPTAYGTSWLNWLKAVAKNPSSARPFFRGQNNCNPIFPNDHNWRKPFTKTQNKNPL